MAHKKEKSDSSSRKPISVAIKKIKKRYYCETREWNSCF